MSLGDDIKELRDRALDDLTYAHDYYTDTRFAWSVFRESVDAGREFSLRNEVTGSTTTPIDLAGKATKYVAEQLADATFQQFIAIFESFFFDLLRLWLSAYPRNLASRRIDFKAVLEAPDKNAITQLVIDKELTEVAYDRPAKWFAYLEEKTKLGCPTAAEIDRIAEAKASRDVLVHSRGIASKIYESKAGAPARFRDGQRIAIPEHYHRETWMLLKKVVTDISNAAIAKVAT